MKIGIDARFYGEAGPGRYVSQLINRLEAEDSDNRYVVFLKKSNFGKYWPKNPNFSKRMADFPWYSFSEQIFFPVIIYRENFDLIHFTQINVPFLYFKPFVVTIHDVILHEFSTERGGFLKRLFYRLKKIPYYLVFAKAVYASKYILTPSQTTKNDLLKYYRVSEKKIIVTYEAADHYSGQDEGYKRTGVLETYGIEKPYILSIGSFYPHKNVDGLIRAYRILRERGVFSGQLVLVGKESYFSSHLRDFVEREKIPGVVFPGQKHSQGYLADEEVETILANAFAYVQPALKEGFGLPPVEAMVFGVPTAVSNIECFCEMCGEASLYFDPRSVDDISEKMERVLTDGRLRDELINKGLENIRRFSWGKMARQTLSAYKSSLSDKL